MIMIKKIIQYFLNKETFSVLLNILIYIKQKVIIIIVWIPFHTKINKNVIISINIFYGINFFS